MPETSPPPICPICRKPATGQHLPFCSVRCAQVDLNRWLTGNYRIETDEDENTQPDQED